jgi:hypothetical protein
VVARVTVLTREDGDRLGFVTVAPKVFLSYRRADTGDVAEQFSGWLREDLGGTNVFRDKEDLIGGQPWRQVLTEAVTGADVALILIGDKWIGEQPDGSRRIDEAVDPVRIEVRDALRDRRPGTPVPILVDVDGPPTRLPGDVESLFEHHSVIATRENLRRPVSIDYKQVLVSVWEAFRARQVRGVLVVGASRAGTRVEELVGQLRDERVIDARELSRFASGVVVASARRAKRGHRRWPQVIVVVEPGDEKDQGFAAVITALSRHPAITRMALVATGAGATLAATSTLAHAATGSATVSTHTVPQVVASLPHAGSGAVGSVGTKWANASSGAKAAIAATVAVAAAGVGLALTPRNSSFPSIDFADTTHVSVANDPQLREKPWLYPLGRPEDAVVTLGPPEPAKDPNGHGGDTVSRTVTVDLGAPYGSVNLGAVILPTSLAPGNNKSVREISRPIKMSVAGLPTSESCYDPIGQQVSAGWRFTGNTYTATLDFYILRKKGDDRIGTQIIFLIEGPGKRDPLSTTPASHTYDNEHCGMDKELVAVRYQSQEP